MAQGKIDNVKKAEVHVTDQDNVEIFGGKLPTKKQGFCFIARTIYGIKRSGNNYTGLVARRGKSAMKVSSSNLTDWDIDTQKEQPMTLPDHPAQPPEDEKQNTCPQCKSEAVNLDDHFKCDSVFCQAEFIETGTGPELAPGEFEVGREFEAYWMESKHEMHATVRILSRFEDNMTIEINGAEVAGVEVYASGSAEAFRNPSNERAWIHPWNKRELHIKCNPLQRSALKAHANTRSWPLRRSPDQVKAMANYPWSSIIGMLAASVLNDLRNDPGHDEVVFW